MLDSQIRSVLSGNTYETTMAESIDCRCMKKRECSPEIKATFRLRYSSGDGRLSLMRGAKDWGTSSILPDMMVVDADVVEKAGGGRAMGGGKLRLGRVGFICLAINNGDQVRR